jgi:hypothetical protein
MTKAKTEIEADPARPSVGYGRPPTRTTARRDGPAIGKDGRPLAKITA